jgi:hypothetical protein
MMRIQLHDNHNAITGSTLGRGAGYMIPDASVFRGGRVGAQGFQELLNGFVVLNHREPFMANAANFKHVLTHELGHALGLEHSSGDPAEPDAILKNATMYYLASHDGRGAAITAYDQDRIAFGYPAGNLPSFTIDRLIPAVTSFNVNDLPKVPGCNQIRLQAFDPKGRPLTPVLTSSTSGAGSFSLSGNLLTYTPGYYSIPRLGDDQIATGHSYDHATVQFDDGVNLSRAAICMVIGHAPDTTPSDGLPDSWMTAHFGTKHLGLPDSGRHPDDDPDKDGLTNRVEFYLGTNPNSAASGPVAATYSHANRQLSFIPRRFAPYLVEASTSLTSGSWTTRRVLTRYDDSTGALTPGTTSASAPTAEFYRVVIRP